MTKNFPPTAFIIVSCEFSFKIQNFPTNNNFEYLMHRRGQYIDSENEEFDHYVRETHDQDPPELNRLVEEKSRLLSDLKKTQNMVLTLNSNIDKLNREKKNLENDKENLTVKVREMDRMSKQANERYQQEKAQLTKEIKSLQHLCKQHEHTNRQKDKEMKGLREGLRKYQEKHNFKNTFQVIQKIEHHGPPIYLTNAENEYNNLAIQTLEDTLANLSKQNQYLKDCLTSIYKELNSVLELKKETLRRRNGGYDSELENSFQLINFKPETLNLPDFWNREPIHSLNMNIEKFKEAIQYGDSFDQKVQIKKDECVKGVKDILKNYKEIVNTQDQILNKVMLRAKEFKGAEIMNIENKYSSIMDSNELDRAKRFLDEQNKYLQSKSTELERTRRVVQETMRKAEESKSEMMRKKKQYEEEALSLRKQVQVLPAIIEEELNRKI